MSVNHKRPLFAFVIVAIACGVIIANGVRSQAVESILHSGAAHVVAGVSSVPDFLEGSRHPATVLPSTAVALEVEPLTQPASQRAPQAIHHASPRPQPHAHRPAHGPARAHELGHPPGAGKGPGKANSQHGHHKSHARGHGPDRPDRHGHGGRGHRH